MKNKKIIITITLLLCLNTIILGVLIGMNLKLKEDNSKINLYIIDLKGKVDFLEKENARGIEVDNQLKIEIIKDRLNNYYAENNIEIYDYRDPVEDGNEPTGLKA